MEYISKELRKFTSISLIEEVVCNYFEMPVESLESKTRKREIVQARQIAMFFAKELTKQSLAAIGSQIGKKDHATVLHACKTVNNLIDTDKQFKYDIDDISKKIKEALFDFTSTGMKKIENRTIRLFDPRTTKPSTSGEDVTVSLDVIVIEDDGLNHLAYYSFGREEWIFYTETYTDCNSPDQMAKWRWYYPPVTKYDF